MAGGRAVTSSSIPTAVLNISGPSYSNGTTNYASALTQFSLGVAGGVLPADYFQVSVDSHAGPERHFALGEKLRVLRDEGVLVFGTGNVVHNLGMVDFSHQGGYDWAYEFDAYIKEKVLAHDFQAVLDYKRAGSSAGLAVPLPDHFHPLLYVLGAAEAHDTIKVYNDACTLGSLSMTCYSLG